MTTNEKKEIEIPNRQDTVKKHKDNKGLVAAVFPVHYPKALFRAFNILPVEVWGPPGIDTSNGDDHIQAYIWSIVRNGLSFIKTGGLNAADVLVVPHACDSLQGLGCVLRDFIKPHQPVLTFYISRGEGETAVQYLKSELKDVFGKLCEISSFKPSDQDLMLALKTEAKADSMTSALYDIRAKLPLSDLEFYRVVRSREYLPAEEYMVLAKTVLAIELVSNADKKPVILSGIVPEPMELLDAISNGGGIVVADDLASCGRRVYPSCDSEDPFYCMAWSILNAVPDSTRGNPVQSRIDHLLSLAKKHEAKGIIFYNIKFCEPEQFYLPQLKKALEKESIRTVEMESELGKRLPNQTITRIEAFLETMP